MTGDLVAAFAAGTGILLDPVSLVLAALGLTLVERMPGPGPAKLATVLVALEVALVGVSGVE